MTETKRIPCEKEKSCNEMLLIMCGGSCPWDSKHDQTKMFCYAPESDHKGKPYNLSESIKNESYGNDLQKQADNFGYWFKNLETQ